MDAPSWRLSSDQDSSVRVGLKDRPHPVEQLVLTQGAGAGIGQELLELAGGHRAFGFGGRPALRGWMALPCVWSALGC